MKTYYLKKEDLHRIFTYLDTQFIKIYVQYVLYKYNFCSTLESRVNNNTIHLAGKHSSCAFQLQYCNRLLYASYFIILYCILYLPDNEIHQFDLIITFAVTKCYNKSLSVRLPHKNQMIFNEQNFFQKSELRQNTKSLGYVK